MQSAEQPGGAWRFALNGAPVDTAQELVPDAVPLADLPAGARVDGAFYVIALPAGAEAFEQRAQADRWLSGDGTEAPLEIVLQGDRIRWRPGFAVAFGAADRRADELSGLVAFERAEAQLSRLEANVEVWWPIAERDADLTHQVGSAALRRRRQVNAMTLAVTSARMRLIEIAAAVGRPSPRLTGLARRLATELATQCDVPHRIELLEERLEFLADLYEVANERLSEYAYFRLGTALEVAILAVIAIETALLFGGFF